MTSQPLPRNFIADLLAENPGAAQLVAELEHLAGYDFLGGLGWALHDALRGVAPGDDPECATATYLVRIEGQEFAGDVLEAIDRRTDAVKANDQRLDRSRLSFDAALWTPDHEAEQWLVESLLARGRSHLLYAPAKSYKSLFALYVCACLASGRPMLGRSAGPPTRVLYVDSEMLPDDVYARLRSMGFSPGDDDLSLLDYRSLPPLRPLDTAGGGGDLLRMALRSNAELVVLDTIGRLLDGDENANDTAQNFARHTGTPLKREGIAVWRHDHAGKQGDRGARGASAKADDPDIVHSLARAGKDRLAITTTRKRLLWVPDDLSVRIEHDPLRFVLENLDRQTAANEVSGQTVTDAATLDRLGIPVDDGKGPARQVLKDAGVSMGNDRLQAALNLRRERAATEQGGHE